MPQPLKAYVTGLVVVSALALVITSLAFPIKTSIALDIDASAGASDVDVAAGLVFWIALTLLSSALPVRMPRGILIAVSIAPIIAAINLGASRRRSCCLGRHNRAA